MKQIEITCPHCDKPFELAEAMIAPLLSSERQKAIADVGKQVEAERAAIEAKARKQAEAKFAKQIEASQTAIAQHEAKLQAAKDAELIALKAKAAAEEAQKDVELTVRKRVEAERAEIERRAKKTASDELAAQLKAAQDAISAKDEKLKQAEAAEIEARRLKAEAEEEKRQVKLQVTRQLDAEREKIREQAERERDDQHRLAVADKDKQLKDLREQIEELRRKGAQGSQQLTGDVMEIDLLETLQNAFPSDRFERVKKGHSGGDALQTVISPSGSPSGKILWESKRTKTWSDQWLPKLRGDQRTANADIAAIATETLPNDISTFGERDGVWVSSIATVIPVASVLRHALLDVATARRAGALDDSTRNQVFSYLTSPAFRQRVTSIVEGYGELSDDLEKERRTTLTRWNKRQKQLDRILGGITGIYGDLQGIAGPSLPAVDGLVLEGPTEDEVAADAEDKAANDDQDDQEEAA